MKIGFCKVCKDSVDFRTRRTVFGREPTFYKTKIGLMHRHCYNDRGKALLSAYKKENGVEAEGEVGINSVTPYARVKVRRHIRHLN